MQWALLQDPPADMVAAVVIRREPRLPGRQLGQRRAFAVNDYLLWSYAVSHQEGSEESARHRAGPAPAPKGVGAPPPGALADTGRHRCATAPVVEGWLEHPDVDDPYWDRYKFYGGALWTARRCRCYVVRLAGRVPATDDRAVPPAARPRVDVVVDDQTWTHGDYI